MTHPKRPEDPNQLAAEGSASASADVILQTDVLLERKRGAVSFELSLGKIMIAVMCQSSYSLEMSLPV
jgi:hypothetical protein